MSDADAFQQLLQPITNAIGTRNLDTALQDELNRRFPYNGPAYKQIFDACQNGIAQGWMCKYENAGIRYGRVVKPTESLNGYSIDVVDMQDIAGPHHRHPEGEIDLIMPVTESAEFDGHPGGWLVYGPDTAHSPTVTKGRALVLYLLPQGKIEFAKA
jgi:Domain of unknown function (DUF4863)